jgi:hypothetical protein
MADRYRLVPAWLGLRMMGSARAASEVACYSQVGSWGAGRGRGRPIDRSVLRGRSCRLAHHTPALHANQPRITKSYT